MALTLLFGLNSVFLGSLFSAVGAHFATHAAPGITGADMGADLLVAGIGSIILGVMGLISGYGLFTPKQWAWKLAMAFALGNIGRNMTSLSNGAHVVGSIVGIVISGLMLYYLYRPNVKCTLGKTQQLAVRLDTRHDLSAFYDDPYRESDWPWRCDTALGNF